jgi:hypothetical protein
MAIFLQNLALKLGSWLAMTFDRPVGTISTRSLILFFGSGAKLRPLRVI